MTTISIPQVTVSMPFYGCHQTVRKAVDSILNQTYPHLVLVVVNDADPDPPWQYLEDIVDPRLVRFDLTENRGRYYCDAVIWEAFKPEMWAMQDPDDWAEPDRFARMVPLAVKHGAGFAPSWWQRGGRPVLSRDRLTLNPSRRGLAHHVGYGAGVISGDRIRKVGGFHAGFRVGYDTYLMNVAKLEPFGVDQKPLQNKTRRAGSLTTSPETGMQSAYRRRARAELEAMFRKAFALHSSGGDPAEAWAMPDALAADVERDAERLRGLA